MKISQNFDVREFVPPAIWNKFGTKSIWFISPQIPKIAEFYKAWFKDYYKADECLVIVNNWHYAKVGPIYDSRGFRMPNDTDGASLSQHKFGNAFDCDLILVKNGVKKELDYKEVQGVMLNNESVFMAAGVTTIEDHLIAKTWLHTDNRYTGLNEILVVKPA